MKYGINVFIQRRFTQLGLDIVLLGMKMFSLRTSEQTAHFLTTSTCGTTAYPNVKTVV